MKSRLNDKVQELVRVINELGFLPGRDRPGTAVAEAVESSATSPGRLSAEKHWKNALPLSEAIRNQEGRLPAIIEDKPYPRRTLRYDLSIMVCYVFVGRRLTSFPK